MSKKIYFILVFIALGLLFANYSHSAVSADPISDFADKPVIGSKITFFGDKPEKRFGITLKYLDNFLPEWFKFYKDDPKNPIMYVEMRTNSASPVFEHLNKKGKVQVFYNTYIGKYEPTEKEEEVELLEIKRQLFEVTYRIVGWNPPPGKYTFEVFKAGEVKTVEFKIKKDDVPAYPDPDVNPKFIMENGQYKGIKWKALAFTKRKISDRLSKKMNAGLALLDKDIGVAIAEEKEAWENVEEKRPYFFSYEPVETENLYNDKISSEKYEFGIQFMEKRREKEAIRRPSS